MALEPWFYLAAVALFLADILAVLVLSGGLRFRRRAVAASVTILLAAAFLTFAGACPGAGDRRSGRRRDPCRSDGRFREQGGPAHQARLRHHRRSRDRPHERGRLSGIEQGLARAHRPRAGRTHGRRYRQGRTRLLPGPLLAGARGREPALRRDARQGRRLHEARRPHRLRHARPRHGRSADGAQALASPA